MLARSLFKQDILSIYHLELWEVTAFMSITWYVIYAHISIFICARCLSSSFWFLLLFPMRHLCNLEGDFRVSLSIIIVIICFH